MNCIFFLCSASRKERKEEYIRKIQKNEISWMYIQMVEKVLNCRLIRISLHFPSFNPSQSFFVLGARSYQPLCRIVLPCPYFMLGCTRMREKFIFYRPK